MDDPISRIEAALEAGPTPGIWDADFASAMRNGSPAVVEYFVFRPEDDISIAADIVSPDTGLPSEANAAFIAACNPVAIRALLDRIKAAEERLMPKREAECMTLDDWRMRAMNLQEQWGRCSQICARIQGERDALRTENERLREALERLARLGNGRLYGNSEGNMIARAALENTDAR